MTLFEKHHFLVIFLKESLYFRLTTPKMRSLNMAGLHSSVGRATESVGRWFDSDCRLHLFLVDRIFNLVSRNDWLEFLSAQGSLSF